MVMVAQLALLALVVDSSLRSSIAEERVRSRILVGPSNGQQDKGGDIREEDAKERNDRIKVTSTRGPGSSRKTTKNTITTKITSTTPTPSSTSSNAFLNSKHKFEDLNFKCDQNVTLNEQTVEIASPVVEGKYPPNVDCVWRVSARDEQIIRIFISSLSIENTSGCKFDYLEIKGVKKLCGNVSSVEIVVNSSNAVIVFHSDANDEEEGFRARIVAESMECSRQLEVTTTTVVTSPKFPDNYPDSTDCWTLVKAKSPGATLTLTFDVLQLEPDQQCTYDFVEIFDFHLADKSLGRFCEMPVNNSQVSLSVRSSQSSLLLHFHSDQLLNSKGFKAHIAVNHNGRTSDCNWHVFWQNQTLTSPDYPNNYPSNADCEVELEAPSKNQKVVLLFDWLQLEVDANCSNDRLEIWDVENKKLKGKPARVLCGRKQQAFKFISSGHRLRLKFISDDFAEFAGFVSRYTFVGPDQKLVLATRFVRVPENASVTVGSSHLLYCDPQPRDSNSITWYKDEQLLTDGVSPDGTFIIIREFSTSSVGRYFCKYNSWTREAFLTARDSKECSILFRKRPKDQALSEGEFSILECHVASESAVSLSWERNGQIVTNSSRIQQLQNGFLFINGASKNDSGIYFCVARLNRDCVSRIAVHISVSERVNVNEVCGSPEISQPKDNGKIIGGTEADRGAFPWHVMFWDWKRRAFCGGALLNERWVVTAAHCFETGQESSIEVRLGKYDQSTTEETEVVSKIAEIIRHPDFTKETFDNDLALVRVSHHVSFSSHISPICLVQKKAEADEFFFGSSRGLRIGHVTGWGQLKENGPQPRFLQELRVPIVDDEKCRASTAFKVTPNMYCAGYGQEVVGDACKGDSGGPFVAQFKDRWTLVGIVSWGEGCGRHGKYGFYTKINNYLDWIRAIIKL